jgi:hypothetical protein
MKNCRKCGEVILNRMVIDGQVKNLGNRKFCLKCSPWNGHNTKSDDPLRTRKGKYGEWSQEKRDKHIKGILKKGTDKKIKLIEMAGGGCIVCGYNKCNRALTFHHRDPATKSFGLSVNHLWSKAWETVLLEFKKCDLMCANCHAETHSKTQQPHLENP